MFNFASHITAGEAAGAITCARRAEQCSEAAGAVMRARWAEQSAAVLSAGWAEECFAAAREIHRYYRYC